MASIARITTLLFVLSAAFLLPAGAEVRVILKDGRTFTLPLAGDEIDRLEVDGERWRPETRDERIGRVIGGEAARPARAARAQPSAAPPPAAGPGRVLKVGPDRDLQTPGVAAKMARDGDTIEIDATTYRGDVAIWRANNLTIRGVGGRPTLDAAGQSAEGKAIWVTKGANITIENVAFQNARVRDKNGAGIRAEGPNLTVRHALFSGNENGILAASSRSSTILVEHSEFAGNGHGDGRSHGIYVNQLARFVFRFNFVHGTKVGHHVKSRAVENMIAYNLLYDGETGNSSYAIDLNDALVSVVVGNVLQQSARTQNSSLVNLIGRATPPGAMAWIVNNTAISDRHIGNFVLNHTPIEAEIRNNLLVGALEVVRGAGRIADNVTGSPGDFVAPARLDFRLKPGAAAVGAGRPVKDADLNVMPEFEYAHPADKRKRPGGARLSAGAYEASG